MNHSFKDIGCDAQQGPVVGLEVGDDSTTFLPLFLGLQVNDSIGHVEVGDEAPFGFFAQVCGVGLLYDARNGLVGFV